MDTVYIQGLKVETVIGVYDWERTIRQTLVFDLEFSTDTRPAAINDDLTSTLDYGAIATFVTEFVGNSSYQLLETLGNDLSAALFGKFPIDDVVMKIGKPGAVSNAETVGISLRRSRPGDTA
ncbi:MAG: dihydroneopterin aldolase [Pseudomonadales bacterium]|nr:dihydroneopterin aldolase [Pseudomonadales bacterium]